LIISDLLKGLQAGFTVHPGTVVICWYPKYYKNKGLYTCKPAGIYRIYNGLARLTEQYRAMHSIFVPSWKKFTLFKIYLQAILNR